MMFTATRAEQFTGNCVARALYDNIAETPDELAFRKGDVLTVLEQNTSGLEGWWLCMLRGRQGICPANRLRLVPRVYDTGGQPYSVNGQLNSSGGSSSSTSSSSSSSSSSGRPALAAKPGLLSAAVRAHQQKQQQLDGHLFRPMNNKMITLSSNRQSEDGYPEECYDMPRSMMVQQLSRQESVNSDYQEPRSHNVNRQISAPDEGGADYDVPRPHHVRVLHTRTLSVDSSCEYDVPRPSSSTETYDTPRSSTTTSSGILASSSPSPPEECYDVPSGIAVRFARTNGKNPSDRSSGISLFSSESSSSAARSTSSEDSLSLSSAIGHISGRSSRSSVGIVGSTDLHNQSMELYDVPPPAQPAQQSIQEETYDVLPKPVPVPAENDSVYDVPPPPVTTVDAAGQIYDIPPPSKRAQDVQETYDCPKPLLDLPANKANTLPLSYESAMETLERLDAEVSSALTNLLSFWQASQVAESDWAELQLRVLRLRASLQELCDFTRGAIGNAVRRDDLLAVRLARLSRPLQDANGIVQKTSQGWTDLFALNSRRRPGSGNNYELEQLLACCQNLGGDMRQVVTFIQANGHLLFITGKGSSPSDVVDSAAPEALDDYDYVNLESKAKSDQDNEEVKSTLPNNDMKKAFDVLMAQSETLPRISPTDQVSDNDRSVVEFYGDQVETYVGYLSNAIDSFIQTIECNQPPKVFVAYSKFVILNAHKLLCVGDTVHRNVGNAKLKAKVLERSNQLCQGLQTCVQSTKRAGREFPSVVAVQEMLDSVLVVSKLAQGLKTCLLQPIMQSK